jgi:uncharacterized membrane protein YkoI
MTHRILKSLMALGLVLSWGAASAANLKVRAHSPMAANIVAEVPNDAMTLSQAIERARKSFPGRLLHGETQHRGGRRVHVVVIMNDDGLVKTLRFNAATGRQL